MATVTKFANANTVVTTGWTSPTNAYADDGSYATAAPGKNSSVTTDYGFPAFTTSDIPSGSTINSVTAEFQYKTSATGVTGELVGIQLNNNGTLLDSESTFTPATGDTTSTLSNITAVAQADLQTANQFKVRVRSAKGNTNTSVTHSVDYVKLTVDYNAPPNAPTLSSPADIATGVSTTPELDFSATDPDSDAISYEVQVDTVNTFDSQAGSTIDSYSETNQSSETASLGTIDTGEGQSFTGNGSVLGSAKWYLRKTTSATGNAVAKIYAHTGTFGSGGTPTGAALAVSGNFDVSTLTSSLQLITFTFSGANQIVLANGTHYFLTIEYGGSGFPIIVGKDTTSPTATGNGAFLSGGTWSSATEDNCFYVVGTSAPLIDKLSASDTGFVDVTNGADTDPFASGDQIQYFTGVGLDTYYFNASISGPTDAQGVWTNIANAFDGSTSTSATTSTVVSGTSNYLVGTGTTAPTSGGTIIWVRARVFADAGTGATWSSYTTLFVPTGGWTWSKVNGLTAKIRKNTSVGPSTNVGPEIYDGATLLGIPVNAASGNNTVAVYRLEVEVASSGGSGSTSLSSGTTYYWRVRGKDPSGSNTFGSWSSIKSFTTAAGGATTTQTIQGLARIALITSKTQLGKARITATTLKTQLGKSRIGLITTKLQQGLARITVQAARTQPGVSRVTATTTKTQTGKASVLRTTSQTQTGKSRIMIVTQKTQQGLSRITASTTRTVQGLSRIAVTTLRTIQGLSRITASATKTQAGKSRITATTLRTTLGKSNILRTVTQDITGLAHINPSTSNLDTLTDDFNDNSLDSSKWTSDESGGITIAEANQEIEFTVTTSPGLADLYSVDNYQLYNSYGSFKVVDAGNQSLTALDFFYQLTPDGLTNALYWWINSGTIEAHTIIDNADSPIASDTYDSSTMKYLRIRESGGTTYWDYSPDGVSWTTFASVANPIDLSALQVIVTVDTSTTTPSGTVVKIDNFNLITSTQTQLGKADILNTTSQTLLGRARLTVTTVKTILGKANVGASAVQRTVTGLARIQLTTIRTVLGRARIQVTSAQTTFGKARIQLITSRTQPGQSRITASTTRVQLGQARVTATTLKIQVGKAAVLRTTSQAIPGLARITRTVTQTILGRARVQITSVKTQLGRARVALITSQTILGHSRITASTSKIQLGQARVTASTSRTIQGITRVTASATRTILGKASIASLQTKTIAGTSRVTTVVTKTTSGKADIIKSAARTILGISRIQLITSRTIRGVSRITITSSRTQQGKSLITATTTRVQLGRADILEATSRTQTGLSRVSQIVNETIQGLSRLTITNSRTQLGRSRVEIVSTRTQTGLGRVLRTVASTTLGRARITIVGVQNALGRARITAITAQTITGKAFVGAQTSRTQLGKARVQISSTHIQLGKARIGKNILQVVLGRARVTVKNIKTTLGRAAIVNQATRIIQGKGSIKRTISYSVIGRARIVLPFPAASPVASGVLEGRVVPAGNISQGQLPGFLQFEGRSRLSGSFEEGDPGESGSFGAL